ncbi:MAG: transcriptional repressor [Desulfobacterales bacterium]|nr:transcriptional repressor [Desulfobacterales bacterium]MDX2511602.1 transcriptional repressor [Desulfobacterales bacterium]
MHPIHLQEKEQFKKLFEQEGIDCLEDRMKVLEAFFETERHLSEIELFEIIKEKHTDLTPAFISETLDLMCRYGFAHKHRFNNGVIRYEHRHIGQHHDHMICTKCNQIIEFKNNQLESFQLQVAATHGFHMLQHKMEIYGICAHGLKRRLSLIPLMAAKQGEVLSVRSFTGGTKSRMRLMSMGLRVGDRIDVISNLNQGQLVIALDYKRLVLGRGLAEKIMVQPLDPEKGAA